MRDEERKWVADWAKDMTDPYLKKALDTDNIEERQSILTCLVMAHATAIAMLGAKLMDIDPQTYATSMAGYVMNNMIKIRKMAKEDSDDSTDETETDGNPSNWS